MSDWGISCICIAAVLVTSIIAIVWAVSKMTVRDAPPSRLLGPYERMRQERRDLVRLARARAGHVNDVLDDLGVLVSSLKEEVRSIVADVERDPEDDDEDDNDDS